MTDNSQKPAVPNYTPDVGRLVTDRFDFQQHVNGTGFNHVAGSILLSPHLSITGHGTFTDVQDILAQLATLVSAPVVPNATTSTPGLVQLAGDISGTFNNVVVVNIQGRPVTTVPPVLDNVLTWNGSAWSPTPPPAPTGSTGGDLSGTYQAPYPTVIKINGATVPLAGSLITGQVLQVSGPSSLTYGNVSMAGDVNGNNTATTVIQLQGNPIQSGALGATQDGYALTWVNGSTQWQAKPSVRNLARGWATNVGTVGPVVATVIVCSTTITPAVTGRIRVKVTGYVSHVTGAPGAYDAFGIYVTQGASLGPADFTQFLGLGQASTGSNGDNLSPVSYAYDYDKLASPTTFPLGTPVTFNVILLDLTGNEFQVNPNGIQFEVQEVF